MASLNSYGSRIANIFGRQSDHAFIERAKDAFKAGFANRIRQSVSKNGIDDLLTLTCTIPLIDNAASTLRNFKSFKTSKPVPFPIRFQNDAPFTFVGVVKESDEFIPFAYRTMMEIKLAEKSSLGGFYRYYTFINGIISLYMTIDYASLHHDLSEVKAITISSIFENPEEVIAYYSNEDSQDVELPFPNDMLESILLEILKTEFGYVAPENEIKA